MVPPSIYDVCTSNTHNPIPELVLTMDKKYESAHSDNNNVYIGSYIFNIENVAEWVPFLKYYSSVFV